MGRSGESAQQRPRRSQKRRAKKAANQAQTWKLPLVLRGASQSTDSRLCQPPSRLLKHEDSQAKLATPGGMLSCSAFGECTNVIDLPSTTSVSRRNFEDLIVPDSEEETWSGKGSCRLYNLPRTPPSTINFEELVVPESPEETWASPRNLSRKPLTTICFEELVVPESPEESKEPSHRPCKLRKTGLRKVLLKSVDDEYNADLGRGCSELSPSRAAEHTGILRVKSAVDQRNFDTSHQDSVRLPVLAAENRSAISDQPVLGNLKVDSNRVKRVADGVSILSTFRPRGRAAARKVPLPVTSVTNKEQLLLLGENQGKRLLLKGADCHQEFHRYVPSLSVRDTEGPEPVSPFSSSRVAVQLPRVPFGDGTVKQVDSSRTGERLQRKLRRDVQTPVSSCNATPAPTTCFPSAGGKSVSLSSRPLKLEVLRGDLSKSTGHGAKLAVAGRPSNVCMVIATSKIGNEDAFSKPCLVTRSGKPVWSSSEPLRKAGAVFRSEAKATETVTEFPVASNQWTVLANGEATGTWKTDDLQPLDAASVLVGNPLHIARDTPRTSGVIDAAITTGKPMFVSSTALGKASAIIGEGSEKCYGSTSEAGNRGFGSSDKDPQTSKVPNVIDAALINSVSLGVGKASSSTDAQNLTLSAGGRDVPLASFVTGSGKPVSVSTAALKNASALIGDAGDVSADEIPNSVSARRVNGDGVTYAPTAAGVTSTGFCTGSGKTVSVSSMALVKARMRFRDNEEENNASPIPGTNPGGINRTVTFKDASFTASELSLPLKNAEILVEGRVKNDSNSDRVTLGVFSTAGGNHISVSSLSVNKASKIRPADVENDGHVTLPRATHNRNRLQGTTNDSYVVGNSSFEVPSFRRGNGVRPFAKPRYTSSTGALAASVPTRGPEKGKCSLEDEGTGNDSDLEDHSRVDIREVSSELLDSTKKSCALSEIQPGVPNSHSACEGEKFYPANGKLGRPLRSRSGGATSFSGEAIHAVKSRIAPCVRNGIPSGSVENTEDPEVKSMFRTGSGRTVAISNDAIVKAATLVEYGVRAASFHKATDWLSANNKATSVLGPIPGFRTWPGRTVATSSESKSNVTGSATKEATATRHGVVNCDNTSGVGPCGAVAAHQSNDNRESKFGQPTIITSKSRKINMCNPDAGGLNAKLCPTTGQSYQRRNVRAFKPPRMRNQPDEIVASKVVTSAISCGHQSQPLNPFAAAHGQQRVQPPRPSYLQDGEGSRMNGRMELRKYVGGIPASDSEVISTVTEVRSMTSDAAANYRILHLTGGGQQDSVGSTEIWNLLLGLGADVKYASKEWVANHYRWIIWKLASEERNYPRQVARKLVTLDTMLQELKFRYDRELSGRRSAIRTITEGDSSASRTMVLCVSAIRHNGDYDSRAQCNGKMISSGAFKIEVTDGWYRLNAGLDVPIMDLVRGGKLKVGQKIKVCGATLSGCSDPKPPLEAFQGAVLTLHMNGIRRVCLNERLGFCAEPFLPLAFRCIKPDGGLVPKTYVGVTRVYPTFFRETSPDGISVVLSARAEEQASNQFEKRRANVAAEAILKVERSWKPSISQEEKDEGYELFEALEMASEPEFIMADMTSTQLKAFAVYQAKREASRQAAIEDAVKMALKQAGLHSRNVKRFLKVRVSGLNRPGNREGQLGAKRKEGTIMIWDASNELEIAEGSVYCVSGLRPDTWQGKNYKDQLHLQAYRNARWRHVPEAIYKKHLSFPYTCRAPTLLSDMDDKFVFREFDVAATVLHVGEPFTCGPRTNQWLFISDGSTYKNSTGNNCYESQILAVRVNLPTLAFAPVESSLFDSVVGCCNLIQQPRDYKNHYLVAEASELAFISSNFSSRPVKHLQAAADDVSKWMKLSPWATDSLRLFIDGCTFESAVW